MAPKMSKTDEAVRSSEDQDLDSELETLECELDDMTQKIQVYRETLPDQLKSMLISILAAQRPFLPQLNLADLEQNISREENSSPPEDPETAEKIKLLKEKISSNLSAMPIVLERMKDCVAKFEKLDAYNSANIPPVCKRKIG